MPREFVRRYRDISVPCLPYSSWSVCRLLHKCRCFACCFPLQVSPLSLHYRVDGDSKRFRNFGAYISLCVASCPSRVESPSVSYENLKWLTLRRVLAAVHGETSAQAFVLLYTVPKDWPLTIKIWTQTVHACFCRGNESASDAIRIFVI